MPHLANFVNFLAIRLVKQGTETTWFRIGADRKSGPFRSGPRSG